MKEDVYLSASWYDHLIDVQIIPRIQGVWRRKRDNKRTIVHGYYRGGWVWYAPTDEPNTQQTFDGFIRDYEAIND